MFGQLLDGLFEFGPATAALKSHGQGRGIETLDSLRLQAFEIFVREHGVGQLDESGVRRIVDQDVAGISHEGHEGHDEFFADGIDGWIGHLSKELFEVGIQQLRFFIQHRQRTVAAHGAGGLAPGCRHHSHNGLQILPGVAEFTLALQEIVAFGRRRSDIVEETMQDDFVFLDPAPIGQPPGIEAFDFVIS